MAAAAPARGWRAIHFMRGDFESAFNLLDEAVRGAADRLDAKHPALLRARIDRAYADAARGHASQPLVRLGQALRLAGEPREARERLRRGREISLANHRDGDFGAAQILLDEGLSEAA